jgi:hypothetical protein
VVGIKVHMLATFAVEFLHGDVGEAIYPFNLRLKGNVRQSFDSVIVDDLVSLGDVNVVGRGEGRETENQSDGKNDSTEHIVISFSLFR